MINFVSDVDEIPNLKDFNLEKVDNEILIFKQKMFQQKFNLYYESLFVWNESNKD